MVGWSRAATLGDNARFGLFLFHIFTLVQMVLLMFLFRLDGCSASPRRKTAARSCCC